MKESLKKLSCHTTQFLIAMTFKYFFPVTYNVTGMSKKFMPPSLRVFKVDRQTTLKNLSRIRFEQGLTQTKPN